MSLWSWLPRSFTCNFVVTKTHTFLRPLQIRSGNSEFLFFFLRYHNKGPDFHVLKSYSKIFTLYLAITKRAIYPIFGVGANCPTLPYRAVLIENMEKVQKRATKLVFRCKKMSYRQRLEYLQLPTLRFRRIRGDMIETFKILNKKYDPDITPCLQLSKINNTRGNSLKLSVERTKYNIRKYSFAPRVVSLWNSLPDSIVLSQSLNCFKNALDHHWRSEEMFFDYSAEVIWNNTIFV